MFKRILILTACIFAIPMAKADQIFNDDVIINGGSSSLCVGLDCVNGESFDDTTIRLKENNLRIEFDDTSASGSFPDNDWELVANDSTNGGANRFSIEDATGGTVPFTIDAGAPSNSLKVNSSGNIGFGTAAPAVEIHNANGDTPTLRLDQTSASGFTPQIWDIAGNETSFFVRDVTNSSTLPFRIRTGAPSSTVDISGDGFVGINTSSPARRLHVVEPGGSSDSIPLRLEDPDGNKLRFVLASGSNIWTFDNAGNAFNISKAGSGINELRVFDNGNVTIQGTLTEGSSREMKTAIDAIEPSTVLDKLASLPLAEWSYEKSRDTRHLGPMAEDFHAVFGLGSDAAHIAPRDMAGVAMASAQALKSRVDEQKKTIRAQQRKLDAQEDRVSAQEQELRALRSKVEELETLKAQVARIEAALPDRVAAVE